MQLPTGKTAHSLALDTITKARRDVSWLAVAAS
jgi:hypothetical protein